MIRITAPLDDTVTQSLKAGNMVLVSGEVYTARDAAHSRLLKALGEGEELPFSLAGSIIYYTGPCPPPPGRVIGSCGPTTSGRMDVFTPALLDAGVKAMIGKGERSPEVIEAVKRNRAVYLAAPGGAGALLSSRVREAHLIAYPELGPEAVRRLLVEDLPCVVAIDSEGNNLYHQGRNSFKVVRAGEA